MCAVNGTIMSNSQGVASSPDLDSPSQIISGDNASRVEVPVVGNENQSPPPPVEKSVPTPDSPGITGENESSFALSNSTQCSSPVVEAKEKTSANINVQTNEPAVMTTNKTPEETVVDRAEPIMTQEKPTTEPQLQNCDQILDTNMLPVMENPNTVVNSETTNLCEPPNLSNSVLSSPEQILNTEAEEKRENENKGQDLNNENTTAASSELLNNTSEAKNENQTSELNKDETESESSKKALELLVESSNFSEESEGKELDINELSNKIFDILDEGRPKNLNEADLKHKNDDLQSFITKLIEILKDKTELCYKLDKQNEALIQQAKSLKNVIAITKDLLGIRNMEVEHLHEDMKLMEDNINVERKRHDLLLQKLSESLKLNESLKNEYHTQQGLFQSLREKYHEKIVLLTKENLRLTKLQEENKEETNDQEVIEENGATDALSTETVEK